MNPTKTPAITMVKISTTASTNTFINIISPTHSMTITPSLSSTPECKLRINGQYTWKSINRDFYMGPGLTLFFDEPGGGKYTNDQAGCELNWNCTKLRAHEKESNDPNPLGVDGPWVDALTGVSIAESQGYAVKCSLSKNK
jgi:hypothetical protein